MEVNIPRFQEYEPLGIVFYVKTLSSDFNTTLNMGAIFAASDYNVLDPPPVDKRHLENQQYSTSCKPSCSLIHGIECAPRLDSNTHLYVARNNDYQGGDKRLYDLCRTYIGSQGIPNPAGGAATPLGEMWVTYQFAFFKPILPEVALDTASAHFQLSNVTAATPLNVALVAPNSNPGFTVEAGHILHIPEGVGNVWFISINWVSVNLLVTAPGVILTNCALGVPPYDDQPGNVSMFAGTGGNNTFASSQAPNTVAAAALTQRMIINYIVNVTGAGPTMNFNGAGVFQAATFGDIHCTQWQLGVNL